MTHDAKQEWFEQDSFWLETYDFLFPAERMDAAESEVASILARLPVAPRRALDLGCGPGRHAVALAQRGVEVTGVDRTAPLLDRARERARLAGVSVEFVQEDMREFARPDSYDLAINLFSSFGYWREADDDVRALTRVLANLVPGGRLIMEMTGREQIPERLQERITRLDDGATLEEADTVVGDRLDRRWTVRRAGRTHCLEFSHRLYSGPDLSRLLTRAGFADVALYGNLEGAPFDGEATRLVAVASRSL